MIRVAGSGACHKGADGRKNIFVNAASFSRSCVLGLGVS